MAQEYSDRCIFDHNPDNERKFSTYSWVGQNIAYWSGKSVTRYNNNQFQTILIKTLTEACRCGLMKLEVIIMTLNNVLEYVVITLL